MKTASGLSMWPARLGWVPGAGRTPRGPRRCQAARLALGARRPLGLSLLEVILAIAILGGCMAVIGELVRMGVRNAEEARELTRAQLLCESKLEEVAAGVLPLEAAAASAFELDPEWTYSIETGSLDQQGLVQVRVTVQQVESDRLYPLTFTLSRWMLDPSLTSGTSSTGSTTEGQTQTSGSSNGASM